MVDKVRAILSTYTFTIDDNMNNIVCSLGRHIIIDPFTASCGCHYCHQCIKDYVGDKMKVCPGDKEACREDHLVIDENVCRNPVLRRIISATIVTCPNKSCDIREKLENMEEHLRLCTLQSVDCPYQTLGCPSKIKKTEQDVSNHLSLDRILHEKLVIDALDNHRNNDNSLKQIVEKWEKEIDEFQMEREINKRVINTLIDNDLKKDDLIRKLSAEIEEMKLTVTKERESQNEIITKERMEKEEMIRELNGVKSDVASIKKKQEDLEDKNNTCKDDMDLIRKLSAEIDEMKLTVTKERESQNEIITKERMEKEEMIRELNGVKSDVAAIKKKQEDLEDKNNTCKDDMVTSKTNKTDGGKIGFEIRTMILNLTYDFVWLINNFAKQNGKIESDPFCKDDYNLRIIAHIDKVMEEIDVYVTIVRGEHDNILTWPMKHTITVSIINHNSLKPHKCWSCKKDFGRPQKDVINSERLGRAQFVDIRELLLQDSLFLCCSLAL